jgi:signal transduction histidine kinase
LKNTSISLRLTFWFSAIVLCGFLLFGAALWSDLAYSLSKGRDRTLSRRAARFAEVLKDARGDAPGQRRAKLEKLADAMSEGNLIEVFDATGVRVLPRTLSPADFPWPNVSIIGREEYGNLEYRGRTFRLLKSPARLSPDFVILVAGQLEDNRNMMARFTAGLLWATPAMLVLSALGGYFLSRRLLRPIVQMTAALGSITIGNLSRRLETSNTGDELQRLAETCNEMLARLESAVDRINRFTADASHELRSPVALIRTVAEYALRNSQIDGVSKDAFEEILAESVETSGLLEDMLTLARADAGHGYTAFEPVELTEVVTEACDRLRPLAQAKDQTVAARIAGVPAWTAGDRADLRRLLSILLDNAIKYTPRKGRIEVELTATASRAVLAVRDSGVGIPEALLPRIFDRFVRADPSRGEVNGTGLGLAIAKWIADTHDATLSVRSRELEGSVFTAEFHLIDPSRREPVWHVSERSDCS